MNKQKRVLQVISVGLCAIMLCTMAYTGQSEVVQIEEEPCALGASTGVVIEYMEDDLTVIPDKYNTGCKGNLIPVEIGTVVNGIQFTTSSNNTRNVLDFGYRNKDVVGTVTFENYDFSEYELWSYNEDKVDRKIKVVFENCKFSKVALGKTEGNLSFEFNNCTIATANGSNVVFNNCQFGKSYSDGLVPFQNVEVNNCFFSDMAGEAASGKELHTDGTQLYGIAGIDVQNVSYNNCRFEIPPLSIEGSAASVNACIMLQLEYSNAKNVSFTDCIVNGGGYSLYAWDKNTGRTFENVAFKDIQSGCAKTFGTLYPQVNSAVNFENISETDALYIASIWQEDGKTHFSVSNDTNQERTLLIYTDKGQYEYVIPACPKGAELTYSMTYADMPIDLDIIVPEECEYAVCFDNTVEGYAKQIRFANWSGQNVCVEKRVIEEMTSKGDDVIASGNCGTNITFTLTKAGTLSISGQGDTATYHSAKPSPWVDYTDSIREIRVGDGIEKLGGQIFKGCAAVEAVSLPDSLVTIDNRAFAGCTGLETITLPASIEKMGSAVFAGTILQEIRYEGTDWNSIEFGSGNEDLESKVVYTVVEDTVNNVIMQGECGKQAGYVLTDDGVLRISGVGATYNYNSAKPAPWYENRELITKVVVEEGIIKIGEQLFRNCSNLQTVELPQGLSVIGKNAFMSCKNLNEIIIPRSVTEIQDRAFSGIVQIRVIYKGTEADWQEVVIGISNSAILVKVCYA